MINLAYRKKKFIVFPWSSFMSFPLELYANHWSRCNDRNFSVILTKIFERRNDIRALLHFIKDQQSLFVDLLSFTQWNVFNNFFCVSGFGTKLTNLIFFFAINIDVVVFIILFSKKFFYKISFSHLSCTPNNQWFLAFVVIPIYQFLQSNSFHR